MKKNKLSIGILIFACFFCQTSWSQDLPPEIIDEFDPNPSDASINQQWWMVLLVAWTFVYILRRKTRLKQD